MVISKTAPWLFFILICSDSLYSQSLRLKCEGNDSIGYRVNIMKGNQLLVTNYGEFDATFYNQDLSAKSEIHNFKGDRWEGNDQDVSFSKKEYLKELDANIMITVNYKVINDKTIKKTISLFQPSMPGMLYILSEDYIPAQKPLRYVTFEYDSFPGGFVHEIFPSAGFITPENEVVGILTDAGFLNQYTRNTRRRFTGRGGGFTGMRLLPDLKLFSVATQEERLQNTPYIRQTFGEVYDLDEGEKTEISTKRLSTLVGDATIKEDDSVITISGNKADKSGIEYTFSKMDQKIFTLSFECKGNPGLALKLFRIKNGKKTIELEDGLKYIDNFPCKEDEWTLFTGSIMVPYIEKDSVSMFIGSLSGKPYTLQIKNLSLVENDPKVKPYNLLSQGDTIQKTTFLFTENWKSQQQYMISSQARLAEGKGFQGSLIEKMLYANMNMLTWISSTTDFSPFNVPNMNYAPDMYNRDAFFSGVATYNKEISLGIWNQWASTQTSNGAIGTIITPMMGSVEVKGNEATIEFLIWALINKRRFGMELPKGKIEKAVQYVLNEFDSTRTGICRSHFPMNQIDIIDYNPKTDRLAVNQGMFALALRTIKELAFDLSDNYIEKAEAGYRAFYDTKRKHLLFDKAFPDLISLADLEPEFLSLWLFKHPILTDEMVINHLDQIPILNKRAEAPFPEYGTTAPLLIHLTNSKEGYSYLSASYQPFEKFGEDNYKEGQNEGFYYNGGSWFRAEYCAYVAGLQHGWKKAEKLMANRIWAEIYLNPKMPFSKEFIPTNNSPIDTWWPSSQGLCWNVFILMADEVAGLRKPPMDPDFSKKNK